MKRRTIINGADAIVAVLEDLGVRCVFGLPGTQNVELFESLRRRDVKTVLATSEAAAGFMSNGWFRASGQPAVFAAIPGPGFAWSLPAIAEASLDSAAVLMITGKPPERGHKYDLQAIKQREIAEALNCAVFDISEPGELAETVQKAWLETTRAGPRPVVLQVASTVLKEDWIREFRESAGVISKPTSDLPDDEMFARLRKAERLVILAGAGTLGVAEKLELLVDNTGGVILTTPTARGVIDESHPMCLRTDLVCDSVDVLNRFLESADLVLALGCRFSHNGTGGFRLALEKDKLVHVDLDREVLQANYTARWPVCMDMEPFLDLALENLPSNGGVSRPGWKKSEIEDWRSQMRSERKSVRCEPVWTGHGDCEVLFRQIRAGVPDGATIVTDTGLHQILARTYLDIDSPRGLIFPSDFQSMGFGLPAAVGAALSDRSRRVVALIGDGSLSMVGAELLTAKREALPLPIIVFCDRSLGQIRLQQLQSFGFEAATRLEPIDLEALSRAYGVDYVLADADLSDQLAFSFRRNGPTLVEVQLEDNKLLAEITKKARTKNAVKAAIGPGAIRFLNRLRHRDSS
jgi:acetolactate synthase I/II/III large subunit